MTFTPASPGSVVAFLAVVVFVITAFLAGVHRVTRARSGARVTALMGLGVGLWFAIVSGAVASGWLEAAPLPRLVVFLGLCNIAGLALALSPIGGELARGLPLAWLVAFQGFRLPLELVLHSWVEQGVIPSTMTWTGSNFDIVSGVLALVCAPLAGWFRAAAWFANAVGFALLLNVGRVAVLSSPLPFAWPVEPPLLLAFHLPYALIVPVCVAGALAGHVVLTRALLLPRDRRT